jgi:Flp pilus assembly protein TadD
MRSVAMAALFSVCSCSVGHVFCQDARPLEQQRANSSDWKALNQAAIAYTQAQEFDKAAELYRQVIRINPAFLPAHKNLGVTLWFSDRKREAEAIFRKLLPGMPKDPVLHLYLALACHERGQHQTAKHHFFLAGNLAMQNPEVLPAAMDSYLATKDSSIVPAALEYMKQAGMGELSKTVAAVFNRRGMYQATITALTENKNADAESDTLLAEAFDKLGQPERAYAALADSIERNPSGEQAYSALANFAAGHDNNSYGLQVLDKGLQRIPGSPVLLVQRGLLMALAGNREQATRSFDAAAQANPRWIVPLLSRGVLELESGNAEAAATAFHKAITIAPEDPNGYYFRALALSRIGRKENIEVKELLRKSLAIAPEDAKSRVLLGQAQLAEGKVKPAIDEFERALRSDPNNSTALYQLALAYRRLGNVRLSQQRMAAFKRAKAKKTEEQAAILQVLKIVK